MKFEIRGADSRSSNELLRKYPMLNCPVPEPDAELLQQAQAKMDSKTKPPGSLGRMEKMAVMLSGIQGTLEPMLERKSLFVFAADHGITAEGVSAFPREVTRQMVTNFLGGGAAINVLCRQFGIDMRIIDMGVAADLSSCSDLICRKVAYGTRNFAREEAMTEEQALQSLRHGMDVFYEYYSEHKPQILGLGEMGIGNTTSATAIIALAGGISPVKITGRGTGIDDKGLEHKTDVLRKALAVHRADNLSGLDLLKKVGGFEIGGMAGAALAAASRGVAVVLDGVISTAAGLIAYLIQPRIRPFLLAGHRSVEKAQQTALEMMGLEAVVDLEFRLGEGTGAAVAINLMEASARIMREMASFDGAGVSRKTD